MMQRYEKMVADAQQAHLAGDFDKAGTIYNALLRQNPAEPTINFMIGTLYTAMEQYGLALAHFELSLHGDLVPEIKAQLLNNMGLVHKNSRDLKKAREAFGASLACRHSAATKGNLGATWINHGEPERAEKLLRESLEEFPDEDEFDERGHVNSQWNLALALLEQGQYAEGWPLYHEAGVGKGDRKDRSYEIDLQAHTPWWDGEDVGTLIITGEQGIGDEIMFGTAFNEAADHCDHLIIDCTRRLVPTFTRSFNHAEVICSDLWDEEARNRWCREHHVDAKALMGDVAGHFRQSDEDFERAKRDSRDVFLRPSVAQKRRIHEQYLRHLPDRPLVLINWTSGTPLTNQTDRTLDLEAWGPILHYRDRVNFVSASYKPTAPGQAMQYRVHHWADIVEDMDALVALHDIADLVISVQGTTVHTAGALGVDCVAMLPYRVRWCYGMKGEAMPWYSSVKCIRQTKHDDWAPVVIQAADRLGKWLDDLADERTQAASSAIEDAVARSLARGRGRKVA